MVYFYYFLFSVHRHIVHLEKRIFFTVTRMFATVEQAYLRV
uniref:Uncharacterized protein n=1 Tax=Anguilla anguilla TaxID=7936 RepID=A0A0E9WL03_ANGAN